MLKSFNSILNQLDETILYIKARDYILVGEKMEMSLPRSRIFNKYNNFLRYLIISRMCNREIYLKAIECLVNGKSPSSCKEVPDKKTVTIASITYRRTVVGNPNDRLAKLMLEIVKNTVPVLVEENGENVRCTLCNSIIDSTNQRRLLCYNHMFYHHFEEVYAYMVKVWNELIKTIKTLRARR